MGIPLTEWLSPFKDSLNQLRNSREGVASSSRCAGGGAGFATGTDTGRTRMGPLVREVATAVPPTGRADEGAVITGFDLPLGPTVVQAPPEAEIEGYTTYISQSIVIEPITSTVPWHSIQHAIVVNLMLQVLLRQ